MKFGIDSLAKAMPVTMRSKLPPLRTAHWMANGILIRRAAISASSISSSETGKRARMAPSTGSPVRNDRPKSPCRMPPSQLR